MFNVPLEPYKHQEGHCPICYFQRGGGGGGARTSRFGVPLRLHTTEVTTT